MAHVFRSFFLLILLFSTFSDCFAQASKVDSLETLLQSIEADTNKVILLNQTAYLLRNNNPQKMRDYGFMSKELALSLRYIKGAAEADRLIGIYYKVVRDYDSALYYYNHALSSSKSGGLIQVEASTLNNIGNVHRNLGAYDSAMVYYLQSLSLRKELGNKSDIASSLINIGNVHNHQTELVEALDYYEQSENLLLETNNMSMLATVLNNIGGVYWYRSDFSTALDFFQRSASLRDKLNDRSGLATAYTNLGMIYSEVGDDQKEIDYLVKAKNIYKELGDKAGIAKLLHDIGIHYHEINDNESALEALHESLEIYELIGNYCQEIDPLISLGRVYYSLNQPIPAKKYFSRAINGARECNNSIVTSSALNYLAKISWKEGNYPAALKQLNEAFKLAQDAGVEFSDIIYTLYLVHKDHQNEEEALKYFELYKQRQDSIFSHSSSLKIARLEAEYELQKLQKEQEAQAKLKGLEQEKSLEKEVYIRNAFITGFIAMLIIAFLLYINYRLKIKDNQLLNQLNVEVKEHQEELKAKADDLKSANDHITHINKNLENIVTDRTKVIADQNEKIIEYITYNSHQVRAPLARLLGLAGLLQTTKITTDDHKKIIKSINIEAKDLDTMVTNMNRALEKEMKSSE